MCGFGNVLCSENCVTFSFCNSSCGFIFDLPFSGCCWLLSVLIFFSNLILLDCGCARQYDYYRQSKQSSHLLLKRFIFNMKDISTTWSPTSSPKILLDASLTHSSGPPSDRKVNLMKLNSCQWRRNMWLIPKHFPQTFSQFQQQCSLTWLKCSNMEDSLGVKGNSKDYWLTDRERWKVEKLRSVGGMMIQTHDSITKNCLSF